VGGESDVSLPLVGPEPLATGGRADNDRHLDETVNRERSPNDFAELDRHNCPLVNDGFGDDAAVEDLDIVPIRCLIRSDGRSSTSRDRPAHLPIPET
jgi:hypothetical protein